MDIHSFIELAKKCRTLPQGVSISEFDFKQRVSEALENALEDGEQPVLPVFCRVQASSHPGFRGSRCLLLLTSQRLLYASTRNGLEVEGLEFNIGSCQYQAIQSLKPSGLNMFVLHAPAFQEGAIPNFAFSLLCPECESGFLEAWKAAANKLGENVVYSHGLPRPIPLAGEERDLSLPIHLGETPIIQANLLDMGPVQPDIIIQQVNCRGVMGAGLAKALRDRYPALFQPYKEFCDKHGDSALGRMLPVLVSEYKGKKFVCNCFGQTGYGRSEQQTDYSALEKSLADAREFAKRLSASEKGRRLVVGIPYGLGCGLGGGNWNQVYPIINRVFRELDASRFAVYIYRAPTRPPISAP